jgi:site-specific recombinase XerD
MSDNIPIQEAMRAFLRDLNSDHTSQAYGTPLKHFCQYLEGQGVHCDRDAVTALTVDHAIGFVPWLRHDHFPDPDRPAKATLQLYLTAVYRFYRALLKQGVAFDASEIARLEETYRDARNIRGERRPKDPKLEAVKAIIRAARDLPPVQGNAHADVQKELSRLRDIAIVETLRSTGCRVGELVSMRRGDLDWMAQSALVKGKGTKYRKVYFDDAAWAATTRYLRERQDGEDARALAHYPVFCGHGNRSGKGISQLTTRHVARTIQRLAKRAGIAEVGVTPHYFRHVFATRALERTQNLALVQDMLGHASPATTRVYAKTDETQRQEGFARVWGQGGTELDLDAVAARGGSFEAAVSMVRGVRVAQDPAPQETRDHLLRRAAIELLWSTGCTLDELLALTVKDVDHQTARLSLSSGGQQRTVYPSAQALAALQAYLQARGAFETGALFCTVDGMPLSREEAQRVLRGVAEEQGVDGKRLFADLFRGVFIHLAREAMGNEREVDELVGEDLGAADRVAGAGGSPVVEAELAPE